MVEILTIQTPSLGDRSYLVTDGAAAFVVDPQRDIDRVLTLTANRGIAVTHVFETHIHNDYVTGGLALARATGAAYHVNAADAVAFDRVAIVDGDVVSVGASMRVTGHRHPRAHVHAPVLRAGGHGHRRSDRGVHRRLAAARVGRAARPARRRARARPRRGAAHVAPAAGRATAGPGRDLSHPRVRQLLRGQPAAPAPPTPRSASERGVNPALALDEDSYVTRMLAGLDAYPAYYAQMGPANAAGPAAPELTPPAVSDVAQIRRRIDAGEWVVDLRNRRAFAAGHLPGSLSFEYGDSLVANLGWLLPPGTPLTLIGDSPDQVADAQRDLARIGIERIAGMAGPPQRVARRSAPTGVLPRLWLR